MSIPNRIKKYYMSQSEAEEVLDVSYATLRRMRLEGELVENEDWITHKRRVYFKKSAINRLLDRIAPVD